MEQRIKVQLLITVLKNKLVYLAYLFLIPLFYHFDANKHFFQ